MHKLMFPLYLIALAAVLGCSGSPPPPTSVTEDDRQAQIEAQKSVDVEEAAHRRSGQ